MFALHPHGVRLILPGSTYQPVGRPALKSPTITQLRDRLLEHAPTLPTVHGNARTGDQACNRRGEEHGDRRDFLRAAEPAKRHFIAHELFDSFGLSTQTASPRATREHDRTR